MGVPQQILFAAQGRLGVFQKSSRLAANWEPETFTVDRNKAFEERSVMYDTQASFFCDL